MKFHNFAVLVQAILTLTLAAQNAPVPVRGPSAVPPPVAPPNMGNLAIHFKGTMNANIPLDVTVAANGANTSDPLMDIRVVTIVPSGNGYVVDYIAHHLQEPGRYQFVTNVGVAGSVFLKPGQPVQVAKCADTDVTLTLTELAQ